ncbi:MAG: hypothetical protein IKQ31_01765 [Clostridia bacterium]|nr:hypothetical protein [Clostridia bacterium]
MEKLALTKEQKSKLDKLDKIIKSGDVNEMLSCTAKLMAEGLNPKPRQIAKMSAHIYKTQDPDLNVEFATEFGGMGAFVRQMGNIVLGSGTAEDNFDFAQYVSGADILKHGYVIYKKKNKMWWFAFARRFPVQARQIEQGIAHNVDKKKKDKKKKDKSKGAMAIR